MTTEQRTGPTEELSVTAGGALIQSSARTPSITNLISAETQLVGRIVCPGGIRVKGVVVGSITVPAQDGAGDILIEEGARVEGTVSGARVIVRGHVEGIVVATEHLEVGPNAVITQGVLYASWTLTGGEIGGRVKKVGPDVDVDAAVEQYLADSRHLGAESASSTICLPS